MSHPPPFRTTRAFDNCFENHDGNEVAVAIFRRAMRNEKIARNLGRYMDRALAEACADRMANIPTWGLADAAHQTRARKQAAFQTWPSTQTAPLSPDQSRLHVADPPLDPG
jgi:hypothetical protein